MGKLRGLSRRMTKCKKRVSLKMEKHLRVKNGYVKITLFGINSYYKCFGDDVATHEDIGNLFEQFNQIIAECKRELRN